MQPIILIFCLYFGNSVPERYLIASFIVSLLGIVLFATTKTAIALEKSIIVSVFILGTAALLMSIKSLPNLNTFRSNYNAYEDCLAGALSYKPANGLADYWVARPLDIYNASGTRILQAKKGPAVYPWLNNLASYEHKDYSFFIIQRNLAFTVLFHGPDVAPPPGYASVSACKDFYVYHYPPGTKGHMSLNNKINDSLNLADRLRQEGTLPSWIEQY
jgi:hypothetical protein